MSGKEILLKTADLIEARGQVTKGQQCAGSQASDTEAVCLVCAMCVASGGRPGVVNEDAKDAMWEFATYLGLKLPGDLWDWDSSKRRAGWFIAGMLRRAAAGATVVAR